MKAGPSRSGSSPGSVKPADAEALLAALAASSLAPPPSVSAQAAPLQALPGEAESALRYRALLEQIPAVIFMGQLEEAGVEAYVSPHIEKLLGFTRQEWLDDPLRWYQQIHPDDRQRWNVEAASLILTGQPLHSVYRVLARAGRVVWFQCDVQMVRRPDGRPWFLHGVAVDISELKTAEEELRQSRDELDRRVQERTAELSRTNQELERSNTDLEQFAYSASHDLQEPIRNIAICAELLSRGYGSQLDQEARGLIATIHSGARRMESLIRGLLEYARAARPDAPMAEPADPSEVMRTVAANLELSLRAAGAQLTWDALPGVHLAALRLQQVLQNLISNSLKYRTTEPLRIHVSARRAENGWTLWVEDNGRGIAPEYHGWVFGLFRRIDASPGEGTGLGLAICKRIVEQAGGRIWIESSLGRGTRVLFTLPGSG